MLSRLSVRGIPERRLRQLGPLPTSMDVTPPLETRAILNPSRASDFRFVPLLPTPLTTGSLRGRIWPGELGARKFPDSPPGAITPPGGRTTPITGTAAYAPFTPSHDEQHSPP